MKKSFLILFVLGFLFECLNAQRYLPGQHGIQLIVGTVNGINPQQAFYGSVSYSTYTQNESRWILGIEFLQKQFNYEQIPIPVTQFTSDVGYYYSFISDPTKTFHLSIGALALFGYETINWGKKTLFDGATLANNDGIVYGGAVTLELETFITNRIILLIISRQRILWGSSIGKHSTQLGIGAKFILN